jgi:protein-tyrosine phosphatase
MFNEVYDGLYVGEVGALRFRPEVRAEGISAIVRLDQAPRERGQWTEDFFLLDSPIPDGEYIEPDTIDTVTRFIYEQLNARRKVLVHCQMGISRSVSMAMAYLIAHEGFSLAEAFGIVREGRASAYPHERLLVSLIERYNLPYDPNKVYNPEFLGRLITDA